MNLAPYVYHFITFVGDHLSYWVIPVVLVYQLRYLCNPKRRHEIGMVGWGHATRSGKPVFFYFLWFLQVAVTLLCTFLFLGYLVSCIGGVIHGAA